NLADVIIVNLHFGEEYHLYPNNRQKSIVRTMSDAGANVIIGHHPHVIQPPEWIENSRGTKSFVAYSMGNFFSGQKGLYRQIGAVLSMKIRKPDPNYREVIIESPQFDLTYTNQEEKLKHNIYTFQSWKENHKFIKTTDGKFLSNEVFER